jgi:mannosyltransferase
MNFLAHHTVVKFFTESLWRDEAFSWAMATRGLALLPLTARDFNPPLYYLVLYGWMRLFGASETAMRSLSVIFFAATLWVVWRWMTDLLAIPPRRAVLYLGLFALNPMLSYFAVEARMYSLLAFLAAASFYAYQTRRSILYVATTTAGLYTHYFMMLVVLTQIVHALVSIDRGSVRRQAVVLSAPVLLFAPWLMITVFTSASSTAFWIEPPGIRFVVHLLTAMYTGHDATYGFLDRRERWLFAVCLIPCVAWTLLSAYRATRQRRPVFLLVALWGLLPPALAFVAAFFKPVFLPRYLIFSTVGLLLLLTIGLERARPVVRLAMLALLCGLALDYQVLQAHRHSKGEYRETIRLIARQAGPHDVLYVHNELDFFPAQYYFDRDRVFLFGPIYDQIPPYVGKVLIPRDRVVHTIPQPPVRVFVLQNHHEYVELSPAKTVGRLRPLQSRR